MPERSSFQRQVWAETEELRRRAVASERYVADTLARATRLTQVISVLGNATQIDRVVSRAAPTVCELFSADLAVLMLGEDRALRIAGHWGVAARDVPPGRIAITQLDALTPAAPVSVGPASELGLPAWLDRYHGRHAAWARLLVGGESLGLLLIVRLAEMPFAGSDQTELRAVANRLAMAVENGLLHERMRARIEQLARLQAFTMDLAGTLELGAVAQRVADEALCVTDAAGSAVYLDQAEPRAVGGPRAPSSSWTRVAIETAAGTIGQLAVSDAPAPGSEAAERLTHLLGLAGLALEKALLYERSREQARRDSLTGLLAHRTFQESLAALERQAAPFTLVLVDIDDFKQINDLYGHPAGDEALRAVAGAITAAVRVPDMVYRIGGEEFCVLLPSLRAASARDVAERLRLAVAMVGTPLPLTVSVGLATFPDDAVEREELLARADAALYASKASGKNMTTLAGSLADDARPTVGARRLDLRLLHQQDPAAAVRGARVAKLAVTLARRLRVAPERLPALRRAAMLRDLGMLAIPRAILQRPGPLDPDELRLVQTHCRLGAELLRRAGEPDAAEIVLQHHENVDGSGYPEGLHAEQIEIESRIVRVVDAFVAITSERPDRAARSPAAALSELARCSGSEFDPAVVEALRAVLIAEGEGWRDP